MVSVQEFVIGAALIFRSKHIERVATSQGAHAHGCTCNLARGTLLSMNSGRGLQSNSVRSMGSHPERRADAEDGQLPHDGQVRDGVARRRQAAVERHTQERYLQRRCREHDVLAQRVHRQWDLPDRVQLWYMLRPTPWPDRYLGSCILAGNS